MINAATSMESKSCDPLLIPLNAIYLAAKMCIFKTEGSTSNLCVEFVGK